MTPAFSKGIEPRQSMGGTMEWLEFGRWSDEVTRDLAARLAVQGNLAAAKVKAQVQTPMQQREQLESLLRSHPASNPWGHPVELY